MIRESLIFTHKVKKGKAVSKSEACLRVSGRADMDKLAAIFTAGAEKHAGTPLGEKWAHCAAACRNQDKITIKLPLSLWREMQAATP